VCRAGVKVFFGNPAVIDIVLRSVALRPWLSPGLPLSEGAFFPLPITTYLLVMEQKNLPWIPDQAGVKKSSSATRLS